MAETSPTRLIVVPIVRDERDRVLLCKMPVDRGVFPGQWGLPGGGVEPGEEILAALAREVREELGVALRSARPLFFKDGSHVKAFPDGSRRRIYMVFLIFECRISGAEPISLNAEFCEYAWVERGSLAEYDLNVATRDTFERLGIL